MHLISQWQWSHKNTMLTCISEQQQEFLHPTLWVCIEKFNVLNIAKKRLRMQTQLNQAERFQVTQKKNPQNKTKKPIHELITTKPQWQEVSNFWLEDLKISWGSMNWYILSIFAPSVSAFFIHCNTSILYIRHTEVWIPCWWCSQFKLDRKCLICFIWKKKPVKVCSHRCTEDHTQSALTKTS